MELIEVNVLLDEMPRLTLRARRQLILFREAFFSSTDFTCAGNVIS